MSKLLRTGARRYLRNLRREHSITGGTISVGPEGLKLEGCCIRGTVMADPEKEEPAKLAAELIRWLCSLFRDD